MPWQYDTNSIKEFIITNCTVWTCDKQGKMENAEVIVSNSKIQRLYNNKTF